MKKFFIGQHFGGRTKEDILAERNNIASLLKDQEEDAVILDTWIDDDPPEELATEGLWYNGKRMEILAQADAFVDADLEDAQDHAGCLSILTAAQNYGLEHWTWYADDNRVKRNY